MGMEFAFFALGVGGSLPDGCEKDC